MLQLSARALKLAGLLKRVDNFDLSTFRGRLVFQKTVYFLQSFGIYLGYGYSWYLYGPYSPGLTRDGFDFAERFDALPSLEFRNEESRATFKTFLEFMEPIKNDPVKLELLASLHFLRNVHEDWPAERIRKMIREKQPYFNDELIIQADRQLRKWPLGS